MIGANTRLEMIGANTSKITILPLHAKVLMYIKFQLCTHLYIQRFQCTSHFIISLFIIQSVHCKSFFHFSHSQQGMTVHHGPRHVIQTTISGGQLYYLRNEPSPQHILIWYHLVLRYPC
jgi:hypothetical protein